MSRTQFLSILRECSGAPRSKMRISFLYYIGSFAVWRGVEYGLVHAVSSCTGGVRRQFENCGYRRQYSKSAYAPLCRRSHARTSYELKRARLVHSNRTRSRVREVFLSRARERVWKRISHLRWMACSRMIGRERPSRFSSWISGCQKRAFRYTLVFSTEAAWGLRGADVSPTKFQARACNTLAFIQGGGALGDASTPGTPAGSIAASAHGGMYSHVAVAGRA